MKTKKGDFQLLNCDDHRRLVTKKSGKDPKDLRPDIVHQVCLRAELREGWLYCLLNSLLFFFLYANDKIEIKKKEKTKSSDCFYDLDSSFCLCFVLFLFWA